MKSTYPGLGEPEIVTVESNPQEWLFDEHVIALIRFFAMNSPQRIVIVSTFYTQLIDNQIDPHEIDLKVKYRTPYGTMVDMSFDDNRDLSTQIEKVIVPVVLPGHFTLAIYTPSDNTIHYYDSLTFDLPDRMKLAIVHAVQSITAIAPLFRRHALSERVHNKQKDGTFAYTCGVHTAMNAESSIFNNDKLYDPHLNINSVRALKKLLRRLCSV